jgi:hypothetical protein
MHPIFARKLAEILDARRSVHSRWGWAVVLALMAGLLLLPYALYTIPLALGLGALVIHLSAQRIKLDPRQLVREVEAVNPELHGLLRTAIEIPAHQLQLSYLQERVIDDALRLSVRHIWSDDLTAHQQGQSRLAQRFALLLVAGALAYLANQHLFQRRTKAPPAVAADKTKPGASAKTASYSLTVTPGDTEVERGTRLVVEARFEKSIPDSAELVLTDKKGQVMERQPLRPSVDPLVFGGMISSVKNDGLYHVEFASEKTEDYEVTTFDYPALVRADATITPPAYTGQPERKIENTLLVTVLEGSRLRYDIRVNKPLAQAELFADKGHLIALKPTPSDATLLTATWTPDDTRRYRLHLVDDRERANKQPPWFKINVVKNQPPRIDLVFPKRDTKVSPLQELPLEAKATDDLALHRAGVTFVINDQEQEQEQVLTPTEQKPAAKLELKTMLRLEEKKVQPLDIVSYYFWAEDRDAEGKTRRAISDLFFAEVRPFEEIFRESEPNESSGPPPIGNQTDELAQTQKQIVIAAYKLNSQPKPTEGDIKTLAESQSVNHENLTKAVEKAEDPRIRAILERAGQAMKTAATEFEKGDLKTARTPAQTALRLLNQAQATDHNVTRSPPNSKSSSQGQQQKQELSALELKQQDQRYEKEKEAQEEATTAEQKESLAVLNRLKELARRQEALAEKMRELQQQLANAKTEQEKDKLANELKRLQDEQEQLLRDLDEVRERTEQPENAAQMAEAREQLNETREKVAEAVEQLKQQQPGQASAAATKAKDQLEDTHEELREKTARRFSEEMKQMREQAQDVAEAQKKLSEEMENRSSDDDATRQKLAQSLNDQQKKARELMQQMQQVSEAAEGSEPLLHRHLYEALRQAQSQAIDNNFEEAEAHTRHGELSTAQNAERKASKSVQQLQDGVEKAAEAILGNESDALRMARNELNQLIDDLGESQPGQGEKSEKPAQEGQAGQQPATESPQTAASVEKSESPSQDAKSTASAEPSDKPNEGKGQAKGKGKGKAEGEAQAEASPSNQPGQQGQKGQKGQKGNSPSQTPGSQPGQPSENVAENGGSSGSQRSQQQQPQRSGQSGQGSGWFFDNESNAPDTSGGAEGNRSPFEGDNWAEWSDRLRNVEDILTRPELRQRASRVIDEARDIKLDARRNDGPPQAKEVALRILKPLVELRDRVSEEIAQKTTQRPQFQLDATPVPERYRDLVRRYAEQLGAGK